LSGSDTWIDFPRIFNLLLLQPDKIHLNENNHKDWHHIIPLLTEIELKFLDIQNKMNILLEDIDMNTIKKKFEENDTIYNEKYEKNKKKIKKNVKKNVKKNENNFENIEKNLDVDFHFDILDNNDRCLNQHAMDILMEISDCINLLVLRVQHVKVYSTFIYMYISCV
jgi:hypothetical protein